MFYRHILFACFMFTQLAFLLDTLQNSFIVSFRFIFEQQLSHSLNTLMPVLPKHELVGSGGALACVQPHVI